MKLDNVFKQFDGDTRMKSENTYLRVMLFTAAGLISMGAVAQDLDEEDAIEELPPLYTSKIEIGSGYTSQDSYKFGEYNGLEDEGAFFLGNILIRKKSIIGDGDDRYWALAGTNLGLDSRNIYAEYSDDGTYGNYRENAAYRLFFEYDQIPHKQFSDGMTPFNGAGTTNQTLPANWVGAANVAGLTALLPSLKRIDFETERERFGGGFKWNLTDHWRVKGSYRHEDKNGTDPIGLGFGSSGGNPRFEVVSRPTDYDVQEFAFGVGYTGDKGQYSVDYTLSLFDNNNQALLFDNPFNNPQWAAGADFASGARGQFGYEPDNEAFQVIFAGGYNFTPRVRATANISYGEMTQDENFLPYSSVFAPTTPLPRTNLDGQIDTLYANFDLSTRVTNKLDIKTRYTYEDRDNNTPRDLYIRIPGDSANQTGPISETARRNWTYGLERHKFEIDGGYRVTPRTKLSVGYEFESKDRDFSEVENTDEHTANVKLSATPFDILSGWVKYQYSSRRGSTYVSNQPVLTGHNPAYLATLAADDLFENDPLMRKYHFADRDRDQVAANILLYPVDTVAFSFLAKYNHDDFTNTQIGLQKSENYSLTFDANYNPIERVNTYAYYTHESYDYDQRGFRRAGNHSFPPGDPRNRAGEDFWTTDNGDKVNTVGAGLDWTVIKDKFNVHMNMAYSRAYTDYDQSSGPLLTGGNAASPLPDVTTRFTDFNLTGDYKIKENTTVRASYLYERFMTSDFALDNVAVDTLSNVILLGNSSPEYVEHMVGISLIYEFE